MLASLIAAAINAVFGGILAWVLVRYTFPGKRIIDALVDLPFALPTAVAGITLTALYSANGWFGKFLEGTLGLKVAFTPLGIVVALTFDKSETVHPNLLGHQLSYQKAIDDFLKGIAFIAN